MAQTKVKSKYKQHVTPVYTSLQNGCDQDHIVAIGKLERHVRKASHCGSKQQ